MKRIAAALAAVAVLASALPASAGDYYRPYPPYGPPRHHHHSNGDLFAAGALGLIGGALIAGAIASPPPRPVYVAPPPVYLPPPVPVYAAPPVYAPPPVYAGPVPPRVAWCQARYRSYNPYSNTFVDNRGRQRVCISPYG